MKLKDLAILALFSNWILKKHMKKYAGISSLMN
jgi:hypothetical protein